MVRLGQLAEGQRGLVTTSMAAGVGVSRNQLSRLVSAGALERVLQGVYRVVGAAETPSTRAHAAWLALGGCPDTRRIIAAGESAAALHGVGDFAPDGHHFVVPARKGTRLAGIHLRILEVSAEDVMSVDGLTAMTIEKTIADLVEIGTDLPRVAEAVRDAAYNRMKVSGKRLEKLLEPLAAKGKIPGAETGPEALRVLVDLAAELAGDIPQHWQTGGRNVPA